MAKQKWKPIPGCSNYVIGSHGVVKRLKHKAQGKRHKILPEKIIQQQINRQKNVYVNVIDDNGKQRVFSVQKLVLNAFFEKGVTYYKIVVDFFNTDNGTVFNNRIDHFVPSYLYDRMKEKPQIFKTIKT